MLKIRLALVTFLFTFNLLIGQANLYYFRLLQNGIESPAALHLQSRLNIQITAGSTLSSFNINRFTGFDVSLNLKKHYMAFRIKVENNDYGLYIFKRYKVSLNAFLKVGKKHILSFGIDHQLLIEKFNWDQFKFKNQFDSLYRYSLSSQDKYTGKSVMEASFNLALLFYDTAGRYFAGFITNDFTEPVISPFPPIGLGAVLPRELKFYGGINYCISPSIKLTSSLIYRNYSIKSVFLIRQDFHFLNKYWAGIETNFGNVIRIYAGYQPKRKLNLGIMMDLQSNQRSFTGNTNYYKLSLGYAL